MVMMILLSYASFASWDLSLVVRDHILSPTLSTLQAVVSSCTHKLESSSKLLYSGLTPYTCWLESRLDWCFCLLRSVTCCPGPHSIPYPLHSASCCVIVHTQTRIIIQASILWTDTLHLSAGVKARLMLLYKTITFCFISCCCWLFADPPPLFPSRISYRLYSKIKIRWG